MNIFVVNESPVRSARELCNKHVVKMCVETAQILSTAMHLRGVEGPYKSTHKSHPSVLWTLKSVHNARWLLEHGRALLDEYTNRYDKIHATTRAIDAIEKSWYDTWNSSGDSSHHTEFVQCMPDVFKNKDATIAYQTYYINDKAKFAKWAPRANPPSWWINQTD